MKKQIVTIVLGAAVMLGTATSLFAQTSGLAVGGGELNACGRGLRAALNVSARRKSMPEVSRQSGHALPAWLLSFKDYEVLVRRSTISSVGAGSFVGRHWPGAR